MTDTDEVCHYLEAALTDLGAFAWASGEYPMGYTTTLLPGDFGTAIGTGRKNTALILATDVNAPAAKACDDYHNNSYTDWFLPSKDEVNKLNEFYNDHGRGSYANFKSYGWYWSSSQESGMYAWRQGFIFGGGQMKYDKHEAKTIYVRAIRAY